MIMSRSYKKVFGHKDRNPFMKKYSNRRLRRLSIDETLANGMSYRKHTNPWDISDWKFIEYTEQEFIKRRTEIYLEYPHWCYKTGKGDLKNFKEYIDYERYRAKMK